MKSSTCFCRFVSAMETPCPHCGRTKSENQAKSMAKRLAGLVRIAKRGCRALPSRAGTPHQIGWRAPGGEPQGLFGDDCRQRETLYPDGPRGAASEADQLI